MSFSVTFTAVLMMIIYAVPGFILVKSRAVPSSSIPSFSKVLLYVGSPCLILNAFAKAEYSKELLIQMGLFFVFITVLQGVLLALLCLAWKKGWKNVDNRVCAVAGCFGNCSFFGIPLLNALMPSFTAGAALSSVYFMSMSIIGWTAGCAIITGDKKYINVKKIILNPATLALIASIPMFITGWHFPDMVENVIELFGCLTAPLCMLIMGMRLATVKPSGLLLNPKLYVTTVIKQVVMPLIALGAAKLCGFSQELTAVIFILCCCPIASIVQSFAEILGEGQEMGANATLFSTICCLGTMPLMLLLL